MENTAQWQNAVIMVLHIYGKIKKTRHCNIMESLPDPLSQACGNTHANVYFKEHDSERVLSATPLKQELRGFWEGIALLCPTAVREDKSHILW